MEDAGLRYVREWISKCFFQDYILFQVHDLASSLAQNVSSKIIFYFKCIIIGSK